MKILLKRHPVGLIIFLLFVCQRPCLGQPIYYIASPTALDSNLLSTQALGIIDPADCSDSTLVLLPVLENGLTDIAISPGGSFYGVSSFGTLYEIDIVSGELTVVYSFSNPSYNSLTCDVTGVLYAAGSGLSSYNLNTGLGQYHGNFPSGMDAAGDLTFRDGKMYMVTYNESIVEVNVDNPLASLEVFSLTGAKRIIIFGLVSPIASCDSNDTYGFGFIVDSLNSNIPTFITMLIDFENQMSQLSCNPLIMIFGTTTPLEFSLHSSDPQFPPLVMYPEDTLIALGTSLELGWIADFNPTAILWEPSTFLNCDTCENTVSTPLEDIEYTLILSDAAGCIFTGTVFIRVFSNVSIFVPSAFSPNGDGANDFFSVFDGKSIAKITSMKVFDRWGGLMWSGKNLIPNDINSGWDGRFNAKACDQGVYVWLLQVQLINGEDLELYGDVTLIR